MSLPLPSLSPISPRQVTAPPTTPTPLLSLPSCPARPVVSALWWQRRQLPLLLFSPPTAERTSRIPPSRSVFDMPVNSAHFAPPLPPSTSRAASLSRRFFVYLPYQPSAPPPSPLVAPRLLARTFGNHVVAASLPARGEARLSEGTQRPIHSGHRPDPAASPALSEIISRVM